jgi:hypothetical protein
MSTSEKVKKWRRETKQRMIVAMGNSCQCCGYDKCNDSLTFHHIDPSQKKLKFGGVRANPQSWSKIVDELRKCVLVCRNCHGEIEAGFREMPAQYIKFDEKFEDYRSIGKYDDCPKCGNKKAVTQKFCSHTCAQKNSRKVDWDAIDLLTMMQKHRISELEEMLGVSNAAIYKRRNKILSTKEFIPA